MKNKKSLVLILVIAALAVVVVILLLKLLSPAPQPEAVTESVTKESGVGGNIREGWDPDVEKDEGSVEYAAASIPGYAEARMKAGDTVLHLSIGNPKENDVGLMATLALEDGTVLYESGLLKPGYGIEEIPLNETLEKGEYQAYVMYQIVTLDEENTPMNAARSAFTLYVE